MAAIVTHDLSHRYGRHDALHHVELEVPEGSMYALVGPNGAGKSTLLRVLMGMLRPTSGDAEILGTPLRSLGSAERTRITYVADGQPLPEWMTLRSLEAYLAPLYPGWDAALAASLRERFSLDQRRRIGSLSKGEQMKAGLLCALSPRPRLLLMDEPFNGIDVGVKDELVRGLLGAGIDEGTTVLISSHDLVELESLADWLGFLAGGWLTLSESMDSVRERFRHVDVIGADAEGVALPREWLSVERAGARTSFLAADASDGVDGDVYRRWFPAASRIDVRPASLREVFLALSSGRRVRTELEEVR